MNECAGQIKNNHRWKTSIASDAICRAGKEKGRFPIHKPKTKILILIVNSTVLSTTPHFINQNTKIKRL